MLPPPPTLRLARQDSLHNKDHHTELNSTLLVLPAPSYRQDAVAEDSIQRPAEPPVYVKLLEQEEDWRASGILHDFNNQLAIILSHCSIALTKLPMDSNARSNLERSVRATKRAADLSSQLQIGRAAQAAEFTPVNLNDVVRETVEDLEPWLCNHATLQQHFATDLSPLSGNRALLQRMLTNILANATEATHGQGGLISVKTEKLTVSNHTPVKVPQGLPSGDYVLLEVCDEGQGMDQETLEHIFEPHFSTKALGAGIGLNVALHIIQLHQGIIYIRSKVYQGTIFQIFFPLQPDKVANNAQ